MFGERVVWGYGATFRTRDNSNFRKTGLLRFISSKFVSSSRTRGSQPKDAACGGALSERAEADVVVGPPRRAKKVETNERNA